METLTKTWNEIATVLYGQGQQNGGAQQGTSFEDMMNGFNSQQAQ
jgi:hypothetical protein